MDHTGTQGTRLFVQRTGLLEDAIQTPIEVNFFLSRVLKHSQQPIFHRPTVELFNDMEDSWWPEAWNGYLPQKYDYKSRFGGP